MPRKYVILLAITLTVVALDQWTKYLVLRDLTQAFDSAPGLSQRLKVMFSAAPAAGYDNLHFRQKGEWTLSDRFFRLRYAENPGAAWGMFRTLPPHLRGPLFHLVTLGAVLLIGSYFRKLSGTAPEERWALYGLPLILGGALGNYIDRLARAFVIDFIDAHWDQYAWPSFNIADSAICVGVGMLVIDSLVRKEKNVALAG